jgi:ABC-2 type transport system ATP-binding protein
MATKYSDAENTISVKHVSKSFLLPHEKKTSIKQAFTGIFHSSNRGFEHQRALDDINFEIKKGEFFGILGRNGSGKSTLLKILAGIYQPTKGKVETVGKLVPFIELGVGFNPELTGRENVFLNGALLGFTRAEIENMYDDIVAFAELDRFMDQKLKNYSSGMQVRLAFSVATRAKADILLIDEVLAVGDADFQKKCFEYFRKLKASDTTVVFVTHDMNAVREYCDRAVLIEKSKVVEIGKASKIASMYTKMFIEQDNTSEDSSENNSRWGTKVATMDNVSFTKKRYTDDDETVKFSYSIIAHEPIKDLVPGFMIKSTAEQHLVGTNSMILHHDPFTFAKDEVKTISFEMPNVFNTGTYILEPAIIYKNGTEVAEWWEEAKTFDVFKEMKTPYLINPSVTFRVES